jgi:predicted Zn-dependent peptidase
MTPPAASKVTRAQKVLRTEWHRTARDPGALAFEIGHFQTMDRWETLQVYLDARDRTTAADIARVAQLYFVSDNLSVGVARSRTIRRPISEDGP